MTELEELIGYLTPKEQAELDAHLIALQPIRPHSEYQRDPIGWAESKLGIPRHTIEWSIGIGYPAHRWDGTFDPLAAAFRAIAAWKDCTVESGTGTGKSFGVAVLILWFLACFENAECYTFAPTEDQLKLYIWKNITELWPRFSSHFPTATISTLTIRMRGGTDERWSAHGRPVAIRAGEDVATRAAGMHAEHMLLVYEETPGIDPSVLAAGKNTCTAPHNLRIAIGNPNHQLDALHAMSEEAGVVAIRMSALDHPNVVGDNPNIIPGAVSTNSIQKRLADYGESSPVYQSRVRGVSPEQASDALIRVEWLRDAARRFAANARSITSYRSTGKGVDVANSEHGDRACIVDFDGNECFRVEAFQCPDANALGTRVVIEARNVGLPPLRVGIDAIGVGAGTVNKTRELGYMCMPLYFGGKPMRMAEKAPDGQEVEWHPDVNQFENLRAQVYWQAREDLRTGVINVIEDKELWRELTIATFTQEGRVVKVLSKDEIKLILGRSPDKADAFVMANWVRHRHVEPKKPERPQGVTAGYDYEKGRPAEKLTAEDELRTFLQPGDFVPGLNRSAVPLRRLGR